MNDTDSFHTAAPTIPPTLPDDSQPMRMENGRTEKELGRYHCYRAIAHYDGRWRRCIAACRRRSTCSGGARGTFLRTGRPLCWRPSDEEQMPVPMPPDSAGESVDAAAPPPQQIQEKRTLPLRPEELRGDDRAETFRELAKSEASPARGSASGTEGFPRQPVSIFAQGSQAERADLRRRAAALRTRAEALLDRHLQKALEE